MWLLTADDVEAFLCIKLCQAAPMGEGKLMTGTVTRESGSPTRYSGIIQADGEFLDRFNPRWINQPAPRDGCYFYSGTTSFGVGTRVTFTANPGSIEPGGTFEVESTATDVSAA